MSDKKSLIIDNVGFDIEAMSKITEQEFVDIHKGTDVICKNKKPDEKEKWLKAAYKKVKAAAAPAPLEKVEEKKEAAKKEKAEKQTDK